MKSVLTLANIDVKMAFMKKEVALIRMVSGDHVTLYFEGWECHLSKTTVLL